MRFSLLMAVFWLAAGAWAQEPAAESERYFPQQLTAQDLVNACASSALTNTGRQRRRYCAGFISGVEEAVRLVEARVPAGDKTVCAPAGVTARRLADVYLEYVTQRPLEPTEPAAAAVLRALGDRFSCAR